MRGPVPLFVIASLSFLLVSNASGQTILLDDFERDDPAPWRYSGSGTLSIVAGKAPGSTGGRVMRLETTAALRNNAIWWGQLQLKPPRIADWSKHHFMSAWIRASGGRRIHALSMYAENKGTPLESHHFVLPRNQWVRIRYPISALVRDNINLFFFSHAGVGGLPGEALDEVYEFDALALEEGPPDPMAGWAVADGRVAFAHCGYRPDEPKRILFPPKTAEPALVRKDDGTVVDEVELTDDVFGNRVADITGLRAEGTYTVEAGGIKTEPFPIKLDAWDAPSRGVMRFIYLMRCGGEVKDDLVGHPPCHLDNCKPRIPEKIDPKRWPLAGKHMEILGDWFDLIGGWHDAGIIDQYTGNTGLMTYALACLVEARPELAEVALEEATWGGRWLVKAALPTGEMVMSSPSQVRWTDNQPRTADDREVDVQGCWPDHAMKALAGMARLAQALGERDPVLREQLLAAVRRVIHYFHIERFPGHFETQFQFVSWGALAGVEAHAATGDAESLEFALHCLKQILVCQDEGAGEGSGFFFAGTDRKHPYRFVHGQTIGVLALCRALQQMPGHEQAPTWRRAVERWCDSYAVPMTRFSGGYGIMAFGLYDGDEDEAYNGKESWWAAPYDPKEFAPWTPAARELRLGGRRVRVFGAHRGGNNRFLCANAAALQAAAVALNRRDLDDHAANQLQWIIGKNPFSISMISRVGHRSPIAYQSVIGDVFGSMYQGVGSRNGDEPFLSPNCHHTQKEIWGVCGGLYLLAIAQIPAG
ncbi:MAG: glycoside hydrolase family 9 protein [Planctomycetota bacterium]